MQTSAMTANSFIKHLKLPPVLFDLAVTSAIVQNAEYERICGWEILNNLVLSYLDFGEYYQGRISKASIRSTFRNQWTWKLVSNPIGPEVQFLMVSRYSDRDWSPGYYLDLQGFLRALLVTEEELLSLTWLTPEMLSRAPRFYRAKAVRLHREFPAFSKRGPDDWTRRSAKIKRLGTFLYSWDEIQLHFHPSYFLRTRLVPENFEKLARVSFSVAELQGQGFAAGIMQRPS